MPEHRFNSPYIMSPCIVCWRTGLWCEANRECIGVSPVSRSAELGKVLDQCEFPTRYPFTVKSGDSWLLQDGSHIVFGSDWTFYSKELLRAHVVSLVNVKWEQKS